MTEYTVILRGFREKHYAFYVEAENPLEAERLAKAEAVEGLPPWKGNYICLFVFKGHHEREQIR